MCVAFNVLITGAILVGTFFVPESPRWLISKYRDEKALSALSRVHKQNEDTDAETELRILTDARLAESQMIDLLDGANYSRAPTSADSIARSGSYAASRSLVFSLSCTCC